MRNQRRGFKSEVDKSMTGNSAKRKVRERKPSIESRKERERKNLNLSECYSTQVAIIFASI